MVNTGKLKGRIVERGYSQRTLAKAIGISKNTLNSKVNGLSAFNVEEVAAICDVLGIDSAQEKCDIFLQPSSQY